MLHSHASLMVSTTSHFQVGKSDFQLRRVHVYQVGKWEQHGCLLFRPFKKQVDSWAKERRAKDIDCVSHEIYFTNMHVTINTKLTFVCYASASSQQLTYHNFLQGQSQEFYLSRKCTWMHNKHPRKPCQWPSMHNTRALEPPQLHKNATIFNHINSTGAFPTLMSQSACCIMGL